MRIFIIMMSLLIAPGMLNASQALAPNALSPLQQSLVQKDFELAKSLLEDGADPNAYDEQAQNPLLLLVNNATDLADWIAAEEMADAILYCDLDLFKQDKNGQTLFHYLNDHGSESQILFVQAVLPASHQPIYELERSLKEADLDFAETLLTDLHFYPFDPLLVYKLFIKAEKAEHSELLRASINWALLHHQPDILRKMWIHGFVFEIEMVQELLAEVGDRHFSFRLALDLAHLNVPVSHFNRKKQTIYHVAIIENQFESLQDLKLFPWKLSREDAEGNTPLDLAIQYRRPDAYIQIIQSHAADNH